MEKDYGQKLSFKYEVNAEGKKKTHFTLFPLILKMGESKVIHTFLLHAQRVFSRTDWVAIKSYSIF